MFNNSVCLNITTGYMSFLLRDPEYYDIPKSEVGGYLSKIGFITQMILIGVDGVIGPVFDLIGRKWPIIIG